MPFLQESETPDLSERECEFLALFTAALNTQNAEIFNWEKDTEKNGDSEFQLEDKILEKEELEVSFERSVSLRSGMKLDVILEETNDFFEVENTNELKNLEENKGSPNIKINIYYQYGNMRESDFSSWYFNLIMSLIEYLENKYSEYRLNKRKAILSSPLSVKNDKNFSNSSKSFGRIFRTVFLTSAASVLLHYHSIFSNPLSPNELLSVGSWRSSCGLFKFLPSSRCSTISLGSDGRLRFYQDESLVWQMESKNTPLCEYDVSCSSFLTEGGDVIIGGEKAFISEMEGYLLDELSNGSWSPFTVEIDMEKNIKKGALMSILNKVHRKIWG